MHFLPAASDTSGCCTCETGDKGEHVDSGKMDSILLEPYNYLARNMGKELRRELITAFNHWLHVPADPLKIIAEVVQMLHNASLIIDDIEDNSYLRRGRPAAHCVFGTSSSINSANFVYFLALSKLGELKHPDVVTVFTEQMLQLHRGQGMDIFWRSSYCCPTESQYREMVIGKTGGLFGLAVRLMQLFSTNQENYKPLLDTLGLLFQIRDDYANLVDTSYHKSKTYADDLTEGKFSFPIVCSIRTNPHDNQVMSILCQRTSNPMLKQYCVRHMAELGALDYTTKTLVDLETSCLQLIERHGGNPILSEFVHKLGAIYRLEDGRPRQHCPGDFDTVPTSFPVNSSGADIPTPSVVTKLMVNNHFYNSDNQKAELP
ncbi:Geranylgeranyl diphosphate synthase type III [Paragonimus heterotremus]|uniref:Geranylgeranyl diphosphate synthase type III n=1 Tax=Paragonimus heterotremus TaxID=100268 RepID=A0A8J4T691_9TREM|nr:Geranylgeranyl diphosphate synthase type III [Paragonimus heterotremus]